jgi:hypothetical protein
MTVAWSGSASSTSPTAGHAGPVCCRHRNDIADGAQPRRTLGRWLGRSLGRRPRGRLGRVRSSQGGRSHRARRRPRRPSSRGRRRRMVFEVWLSLDGANGGRGREVIERFIRRNLPLGSVGAYESGELAALRRRAGGSEFRPHGPATPGHLEARPMAPGTDRLPPRAPAPPGADREAGRSGPHTSVRPCGRRPPPGSHAILPADRAPAACLSLFDVLSTRNCQEIHPHRPTPTPPL